MIAHAFRLIWNRRRAHILILVELLVSFLVLCTVFAFGVRAWENWRRPLGFEYENVWDISVDAGPVGQLKPEERAEKVRTARRLLDGIRNHPEVELAGAFNNIPFENSRSRSGRYINGEIVYYLYNSMTENIPELLGFELVAGRWPTEADAKLEHQSIVLSEELAPKLFGGEDPIGKDIPRQNEDGTDRELESQSQREVVIGVARNYRKFGELGDHEHSGWLLDPLEGDGAWPPRHLLVRVRPGTTAAFEEKLVSGLLGEAPDWSFNVTPLEVLRTRQLRDKGMPLVLGATVAAFLMLTVGMGLVGVLWQNVLQRTEELGLRRALGATGRSVMLQVLGEFLALTTVAASLGALLFLQAPLLGGALSLPMSTIAMAIALALGFMLLFVAFCGLYPSWLATRVTPSRALQYE